MERSNQCKVFIGSLPPNTTSEEMAVFLTNYHINHVEVHQTAVGGGQFALVDCTRSVGKFEPITVQALSLYLI